MTSNNNNYDIDSFLDFSGGCSSPPTSRSSSTNPSSQQRLTTTTTTTAATSSASSSNPSLATMAPPPHLALSQTFSGPSHQYDLHPQQTGLLPYSLDMDSSFSGNSSPNQSGSMSMSPEFNFSNAADIDSQFFFSEQASGEFVQPSNINFDNSDDLDIDVLAGIKERSPSNASSIMSMSSPQQQAPLQSRQNARKSASSASNTDPETEMKIKQILEDVKKRALASNDNDNSQNSSQNVPQLSRMRKDEEDMDEDERLLASEEGKKLSSKERRQLRNKVSARAFRSRRKEYISQLESEVNDKATENNELREKLRTVESENNSLRDLTRMLLASPQFSQFLDQLHPLTAATTTTTTTTAATNSNTANVSSNNVQQDNISVHRATIPEIQVSEQDMVDFIVPSYLPPTQQYSSFNPRKDTNPNQLQSVDEWPLAYQGSSTGTWGNGSQMVFAAEIIPQDINVEALLEKDEDWMCPADGFRPGFSSGILSEKEDVQMDYSDSYDSNGQYIFTVFEDELEDVPEHLYDHFQIHEPVTAEKEVEPTPDFKSVIPTLGLEKLFAQLEERFTQNTDDESAKETEEEKARVSTPETCKDSELSKALRTLETTYKRVGLYCGA